jgi:hypothetical protein
MIKLHHLTTIVVNKYTTTCIQKREPTTFIPKSASWISVPFLEIRGRLSDDLNSSSRNIGVSWSIQAATQVCEHKLHFIIILSLLEKKQKFLKHGLSTFANHKFAFLTGNQKGKKKRDVFFSIIFVSSKHDMISV